MLKLQLLLTGNELMSGVTVDSNSSRIAEKLEAIGLNIARKVTIGDDIDELVSEIRTLSHDSDVLLINGGLGPTIDDLTAKALSLAFDLPLVDHPEAIAHLEKWCVRLKSQLNASNLKQASLPQGCDILANPVGSAVGIKLVRNDCLILCSPGVPSELLAMMDVAITPELEDYVAQNFPSNVAPEIERIHCFGIGESSFQQKIDDTFPDWPADVALSFRAGAPTLEVKLTSDPDKANLRKEWKQNVYEVYGDYFVGEGNTNLYQSLVKALKDSGKKITFAESCTGGTMASLLTSVAGSSEVFEAGYVTYSNKIKTETIGVDENLFEKYGAVSESVASEMLSGALDKSGADCGIACSGIAGPDGGSKEKPVGTVCIAWGDKEKQNVVTLLMPRSREFFQLMVAATGFDLMRRQLLGIDGAPRYLKHYQFKQKLE